MEYFLAAVFGLGVGVLSAFASIPRPKWLPTFAVLAVLSTAIIFAVWVLENPVVVITLVLADLIGLSLAGAVGWEGNPLYADVGYWGRATSWMWHTKRLRAAQAQADDAAKVAAPH